jgi:hypothetical protein
MKRYELMSVCRFVQPGLKGSRRRFRYTSRVPDLNRLRRKNRRPELGIVFIVAVKKCDGNLARINFIAEL